MYLSVYQSQNKPAFLRTKLYGNTVKECIIKYALHVATTVVNLIFFFYVISSYSYSFIATWKNGNSARKSYWPQIVSKEENFIFTAQISPV